MSKKSRKAIQGSGSKVPAKVEGAVQESRPARDEKAVLSPRPRTDHRSPAAVPAVQAPVADKGVVKGPSAKVAATPAQATSPRAASTAASTAPAQAPRAAAPVPRAPTLAAPTHDEIARLAHDLWAQRGRPLGQDIDIWCEAERRLTRKS